MVLFFYPNSFSYLYVEPTKPLIHMENNIKFWALHFHVFNMLKKGTLSLETLEGEQLEAGIYFSDWIKNETAQR